MLASAPRPPHNPGAMGDSELDSYNSRYMDSYKPPTPPMPMDHGDPDGPRHAHVAVPASVRSNSSISRMADAMNSAVTQEELEEKRRRALREREREMAAKQRQRELLAQRREMELKKRLQDEQMKREQEAQRLDALQKEDMERDDRRKERMESMEEERLRAEEERRRLGAIEKKREQTLRAIEMQRMREEEAQRIKREAILKKRKEMERLRDQAERIYAEKKKEEMERKINLVDEMKRKREERLVELEKRRTNPLLVQQEREFNQLIELQASTGRLNTKLEEVQAKREDVRERLLEARHIVQLLEIEERQLSISVEEVESDLKKIKGYQEGLARLVSTRYDDDEYESAVIRIQTKWRGRRDWQNGKKMKMMKQFHEREKAATKIQTIFRGRRVRRLQNDGRKQKAAVKIQHMYQHWRNRRAVERLVDGRAFQYHKELEATRIQCAYKSWIARHEFLAMQQEAAEKKRLAAELKRKQKEAEKRGRGGGYGGKGKPPPKKEQSRKKVQPQRSLIRADGEPSGELGRIYMAKPKDKNLAMLPSNRMPEPSPRLRRFIPSAATAAVAAGAEDVGGFNFVQAARRNYTEREIDTITNTALAVHAASEYRLPTESLAAEDGELPEIPYHPTNGSRGATPRGVGVAS